MGSPRSYLYVPGDQPEMIAKAAARGADALILDLEDAVAPDRKDDARAAVAAAIGSLSGVEVWVRVNATGRLAADVGAIAVPGLHGVVLPKAEDAATMAALDELLGVAEERAETPVGRIKIVPLIESARGVLAAEHLAGSARVSHLALGEADLSADLGLTWSAAALQPVRLQIVLVSAAARIGAPVAPVSTDFRDLDALRTSTEELRDLGFGARAAIHPAQVEAINEVFTPSAEDVARARDVLERVERAGGGVTTDADGRMIDEAVARSARRVLERAR